jgi:hypothetical protein
MGPRECATEGPLLNQAADRTLQPFRWMAVVQATTLQGVSPLEKLERKGLELDASFQ